MKGKKKNPTNTGKRKDGDAGGHNKVSRSGGLARLTYGRGFCEVAVRGTWMVRAHSPQEGMWGKKDVSNARPPRSPDGARIGRLPGVEEWRRIVDSGPSG